MVGPTYHISLVRHLMVVLIYGSKKWTENICHNPKFSKIELINVITIDAKVKQMTIDSIMCWLLF